MDEYLIQGSTLTDIADAIREKTGDDALMTPAEMAEAIAGISGGGGLTLRQGTYIDTGSDTKLNITIPTGLIGINPVYIYVRRRETGTETARGYQVCNLTAFTPDSSLTAPLDSVGMSYAKRLNNDGITYSNIFQGNQMVYDSNSGNITLPSFNSYYYCLSGIYDWYIWEYST